MNFQEVRQQIEEGLKNRPIRPGREFVDIFNGLTNSPDSDDWSSPSEDKFHKVNSKEFLEMITAIMKSPEFTETIKAIIPRFDNDNKVGKIMDLLDLVANSNSPPYTSLGAYCFINSLSRINLKMIDMLKDGVHDEGLEELKANLSTQFDGVMKVMAEGFTW